MLSMYVVYIVKKKINRSLWKSYLLIENENRKIYFKPKEKNFFFRLPNENCLVYKQYNEQELGGFAMFKNSGWIGTT